jgi:hypothetical protein
MICFGDFLGRVFVFQCGRSREDFHRTNSGDGSQQVIMNTFSEKFVFLTIAAIVKREDSD